MVSPFNRYAPPSEKDLESFLIASLEEQALAKGVDLSPVRAWASNPQEVIAGYKQRLAAITPEVQASQATAYKRVVTNPSTAIMRPLITPEMVQHLPGLLQPVGRAAREFTSPAMIALTALTAGAGPTIAGGIRGGTGAVGLARGLAAGAIEPVGGSFGARFGTELAAGVGGATAADVVGKNLPENTPSGLRTAAQIGAGVVGGYGTLKGPQVGRSAVRGVSAVGRAGEKYAEAIGKSNVGNVLSPPAPQPRTAGMAKRLIRKEQMKQRGTSNMLDIERVYEERPNGYKVVRSRPEGWEADQYGRPWRGYFVEAPDGTQVKIPLTDTMRNRPEMEATRAEAVAFADSLSHGSKTVAQPITTPPAPQPRTAGMAVPDAVPPKEPPIPEGYVRLYRGETRPHSNLIEGERGRWWSTDRSDAERYMKEIFEQTDPPSPTARILYTDVSRAEAESIARGTAEHERLGATYKLKPSDRYINVDQDDLINKAKPLPSSSSLQSPAQPPTGQPPLQGTGLQRLTNFIKVQKPGNLRAATEAARKVELGRKSGGVQRALSGSGTPGERFVQGRVAQQGDLPASVFQPAAERTSVGTTGNLTQTVRPDVITTPEINTLYDTVQKAGLRPFASQDATDALTKALVGELPTRSEIVLLRRTLGDEFADALMTHRPNAERYRDMIIETINLPRSLFQTVADFSGLLRQGGVFAASRPVRSAKNSPAFLRAAFSKKYFNEIQDSIRTHPNYQQSQDAGLFIANTSSDISLREESSISRWIQKIPVIGWVPAASERSYVGGLNKLRFDTYNDMLNGWQKAGVQVTDEMKRDAAKVINFSTGRGTLGVAEEAAPYLNAVFYSPRFLTSRVQLPLKEAGLIYKAGRYAIKGDPKTALAYVNLARNTVSFVAAGMGILMLLKLREGPDLKVETDARSSDFGKIIYKNTRYDFWAGYQQIARYTWQTMVAESKSIPESKTPNKVSKYNGMQQGIIPLRFIRSKLSPAAGFATDLKLGETIAGDEIAADKETVGRIAYSNLTPFFIQSLVDAANAYDDPKAALYGLPSASGVGVNTIEPKAGQSGGNRSDPSQFTPQPKIQKQAY